MTTSAAFSSGTVVVGVDGSPSSHEAVVWGAQQAGLRAVHVPHSEIPPAQVGHTEGTPDGVVIRLTDLPGLISSW